MTAKESFIKSVNKLQKSRVSIKQATDMFGFRTLGKVAPVHRRKDIQYRHPPAKWEPTARSRPVKG